MLKVSKQDKQYAIDRLHTLVTPGDTIYCVLAHVSRSGMQREIKLYGRDNQYITGYAALALDHRRGKRDGIIINGCGMDMGFALVYELAYVLYPSGFGCIGRGCPSNDHSNGDRNQTPHNAALIAEIIFNGVDADIAANHWHKDGGYALKHCWL